ncbi:four-carbon acid sugar kinase family protein [Ureibacillus manganicus]|uniref:Hydroxyacid dehydrogenase n=1 Tax=Ureibacillus manganicus DSM 26584 TaxID=1384049 RepID=A0A0A3I1Z4_9BACL|nr:four-carbon acid sugar kinase family protein [Ureibacillus manganicus]KGR77530.1 hydroxyacid dehydrogenase [Ureibacillus manganicus DSM 26584]
MTNLNVKESFSKLLPLPQEDIVNDLLANELALLNKKIVVLDDDPTGVQTVHNVSVYTDWTEESVEAGFNEANSIFFLLTNSRGFTSEETEKVHSEIATVVSNVAKKAGKDFIIISRGDSTLRGHYPLETEVLKDTIEKLTEKYFDGEIIIPFFQEGGRYTINNTHYVQYDEELVPAGETEFAKDRTFGYKSSNIGDWAEEKSNGKYKAKDATYLSLADIRTLNIDGLVEQLMSVKDFNKVIVNAVDYLDVKVFVIALVRAMRNGKMFMFRSAAAFTKVIGGVENRPLLTRAELVKEATNNGGLIMIGSHVKKTTEQFEELKKCEFIHFIEFDVHLVLDEEAFNEEVERIINETNELIAKGQTVTVYTRRERLDLGENKQEEELLLSVKISSAVTSIVRRLTVRPSYMIAKGGITSSDIGTNGLGVKHAIVAGQIKPGIPVWYTGQDSKFPGMAYVIFPGNVGTKTTLKEVAELLEG